MSAVEVNEIDCLVVCLAGDAHLRRWPDSEAEFEVAAACVEVERELRAREWEALETVLGFHDGGWHFPTDPSAEFLVAVRTLRWWCRAPE